MLVEFPKEAHAAPLQKWYEKKRWMAAGGALLLLMAILTLRTGVQGKKQLSAFFTVNAECAKLRRGDEVDQQELLKLVAAHPEIKPLVAPRLIQNFQLSGKAGDAVRMGEESLKRLSYIDPLYLQFARASLLIEEGSVKKALELSLDLKTKSETYLVLRELNNQRIAFLSK